MLPPEVLQLVGGVFPGAAIALRSATYGGFSHHTAIVTIDDRWAVVKADNGLPQRADLRREARLLTLLHNSGLPAPALLAIVEDDRWTVEVFRYVNGTSGMHYFERDPSELKPLYEALARTLAQVHRTILPGPEAELDLVAQMGQVLQNLPSLALDQQLHARLAAALEHPSWQTTTGLAHGDPGLHNLLWSGRINALLDWEWAGWGNPLLDLAWVRWTIGWRRLPPALWHAFLAAYGPHNVTPETLQALALGQIAGILTRVAERPAAWQEWVRRAHWTLAEW